MDIRIQPRRPTMETLRAEHQEAEVPLEADTPSCASKEAAAVAAERFKSLRSSNRTSNNSRTHTHNTLSSTFSVGWGPGSSHTGLAETAIRASAVTATGASLGRTSIARVSTGFRTAAWAGRESTTITNFSSILSITSIRTRSSTKGRALSLTLRAITLTLIRNPGKERFYDSQTITRQACAEALELKSTAITLRTTTLARTWLSAELQRTRSRGLEWPGR
mmetsp:Transcript_23385/g.32630  ORF Transcript_23385/g.32630 Transcript_23385/m.32630 type:complete len:221 (+) Transcript_23385:285-947(+)